jgi:hypothetical protein
LQLRVPHPFTLSVKGARGALRCAFDANLFAHRERMRGHVHRVPTLDPNDACALHKTMNPYWLIVAFTVLTQFCIFLRWLHRRMRDAELERAFVRDIAHIHLPHLYRAMQLIAGRLGITLEDRPSVRFPEFDDRDQQREDRGWHLH